MKTTMKTMLSAALAIAVFCSPAVAQEERERERPHEMAHERGVTPEQVDQLIAEWPETPRNAANAMIEKYGTPDGATSTMLVWNGNGPWNRTVISSEPIQHDFPMPHEDVLEQSINYQVPVDMFDELARYDGSVIVERTKGVISARCDKEGANFLALNLAHDIITGERTVEEAREFYGETIKAKMNGESPEYMQGLLFDVPTGETSDPDETTIDTGSM